MAKQTLEQGGPEKSGSPRPESGPSAGQHFCDLCQARRPCRTLYQIQGYDVVRCQDCGLVFVPPEAVAAAEITGWYSEDYYEGGLDKGYADYGASEATLRHQARITLRRLRRYQASGPLLEIGCAYGFFLLEAQNFFQVSGVEISPHAAEQARRRGLDVVAGEFQELAVPAAHYSAVCLFDCIEHLAAPFNYLKKVHSVLSPGGVVALSTGDIGKLYPRLAGRRWRLMTPPQHLFYFSRPTMTALLEKAGFEVLEVSYPWKAVPWSLVLFQLSPKLKAALGPVGRLPWRLYLNLFDAMLVVARKP